MKRIDNLTSGRSQITRLALEDGTIVSFTVNFNALTERWAIDVEYTTKNFITRGVGIATGPNFLRSFRRILPFGLACVTTDGVDPTLPDDFETGRATLFLLTEAEVDQVEITVMGAP